MRLIYEPGVYLIGTQEIREGELAQFLADTGAPGWHPHTQSAGEALAEIGGRLCYHSFAKPRPGGNAGYLRHILEVGHGSVLEHAVYTLIVTGISRSCSHELVRHRHLSPSQLSQRFVDESDCAFVVPPALAELTRRAFEGGEVEPQRNAQAAMQAWRVAMERTHAAYAELVQRFTIDIQATRPDLDPTARRKAAREAARSVLPNAVETRMCLTGNARAFRGLLDQRARPEADAEIRRLALAIHAKLVAVSPNLFGDYQPDPAGGLTTPHRKV